MYDIHQHLLYGLDDGPETLEASVAQAEMAIADGITHVVATPHSSDRFTFHPEINERRIAEIHARVGDRLTLGLGCDFHLSYENIEDAINHPQKYSINGGQYLLIEFPDFGIPNRISEAMYELRLAGMTLIITHPERNPSLLSHPEKVAEWLRAGHLVQVTAGALLGRFGSSSARMANEMLKKRWIHFLATDAHNTKSRPPALREAYNYVAREQGEEYARLLCVQNPKAAFESVELPDQLPAEDLFEDEDKRSFLRRLFNR